MKYVIVFKIVSKLMKLFIISISLVSFSNLINGYTPANTGARNHEAKIDTAVYISETISNKRPFLYPIMMNTRTIKARKMSIKIK